MPRSRIKAMRWEPNDATMNEQETSIVQKPRDPFSDLLLPQNTDELAKFMDEPLPAIAEAITGAFAAGPKAWMVMGGHIVQGILKARLFQQVSEEIRELREKGKIAKDFADEEKNKYGFKSCVELLTIIDEETPDVDRLEALKAMFYGINKVNAKDGHRIACYQLFQIAKKLTSGQLLYLPACYTGFNGSGFSTGHPVPRTDWLRKIGRQLEHEVLGLLEQDDNVLVEYGLLNPRSPMDHNSVFENDARLTTLAIAFCRNIEIYHLETSS